MARGRRGEKVTPNIAWDTEGTRALNLTVLRRLDPAVADILITATHVAAYNFDADTGEWSRKSVQGSLFIVKRNDQPRFQLVVMNRLNTENLVEDLLTDFQYEVQAPYLMYRNAADEIIGIWFYNPQECHEVAHLFSRIQYAFSRASPKANCASKSDFEELQVASDVPAVEDTLEQSTLPTIVPDDTKNEFLATFSKAAACVGDTISGTGTAGPDQSFRSVPSPSHQPYSASASQTSALQNLHPSRTSSVHMRPFDAIVSHNSATIQPSSLVNPTLLPPMTSTQTIMANATSSLSVLPPLHPPLAIASHNSATIQPSSPVKVNPTLLPPMTFTQTTMANATSSSLSVLPPLHPPLASHQPQSVPLHHHPFPLPMASPAPPYGLQLLQPFPPPKPSPLLTPAVSYVSELTRDQVKGALLRLVQNDNFVDMVYREIAKRPYP